MLQVTNLVSSHIAAWLSKFETEEEGQGLVEYALIIVLVSIMAIAALQTLSGGINGVFERISTTLSS
jgi:pilus assembly protein Flp/PilA